MDIDTLMRIDTGYREWRESMSNERIVANPYRVGTRNLLRFYVLTGHKYENVRVELVRRDRVKKIHTRRYRRHFRQIKIGTT